MFSKLRVALDGGCGVIVPWTLSSESWSSASRPASKSRFMVEGMVELSRRSVFALSMPQLMLGVDHINNNVFAEMPFPISLNVGLAIAADHPNAKCS